MNKKEGGRYTLVALFSSRVRKGIIFNYAESNLDQNARAILLDAIFETMPIIIMYTAYM